MRPCSFFLSTFMHRQEIFSFFSLGERQCWHVGNSSFRYYSYASLSLAQMHTTFVPMSRLKHSFVLYPWVIVFPLTFISDKNRICRLRRICLFVSQITLQEKDFFASVSKYKDSELYSGKEYLNRERKEVFLEEYSLIAMDQTDHVTWFLPYQYFQFL